MTFDRRAKVTVVRCNGIGCQNAAMNRVPDTWEQVKIQDERRGIGPRHYCPTCNPDHDPTLKRLQREGDDGGA